MPIKVQGGKEYKRVSERLVLFWETYPEAVITTNVHRHADSVIVKATIVSEAEGPVMSTGHAEGFYTGADKVIEKTETTAVGRALAFIDEDLMGSEIASADEIGQWMQGKTDNKLLEHNDAWKRHEASIHAIKVFLAEEHFDAAIDALNEIPEDDLRKLRVAPTKGGWLTLDEQKLMKIAQEKDFDPETGTYRSVANA